MSSKDDVMLNSVVALYALYHAINEIILKRGRVDAPAVLDLVTDRKDKWYGNGRI
jgi:hypothetical protein